MSAERWRACPRPSARRSRSSRRSRRCARRYQHARDFLFLGRGLDYPIALEGALKLKEISYIHAEGYAAGEMKHGPIALIDENLPVVVLAPHDAGARRCSRTCARSRRATGIVDRRSATRPTSEVAAIADDVIRVPETIPELQPIVSVVPLQLLAYHVAERRGCDVDQPRNLAKSVTVE